MPTLQVRNLPEEIYSRLVERAREERRSLAQQATVLLAEALQVNEQRLARQRTALDSLVARGARMRKRGLPVLDPVAMIREDRER